MLRSWNVLVFALTLIVATEFLIARSGACAQVDASRAMARQLGAEGLESYQANEFDTAERKLDRAFRLYATPTLGLWSARAREKAGHWVEAAERLREAMRASVDAGDNATQREAQQDAERELTVLLPRIPSLTIELKNAEPAAVSVTLNAGAFPSDAIGLPRPTNPGTYQIVAVYAGERIEIALPLSEAEHKHLPLEFRAPVAVASATQTPAPTNPPLSAASVAAGSEQLTSSGSNVLRPVAYVAMGVGAAALATSGALVLVANSKRAGCFGEAGALVCPTDAQTNSYNTLRTVSTVSFYAGGALLVAGLVTWLVAPSTETRPSTRVSFGLGPGHAVLSGAF